MWETMPQHPSHLKGKPCLIMGLMEEEFEHQAWRWGRGSGGRMETGPQGYYLLSIGQSRSEAAIQGHLPRAFRALQMQTKRAHPRSL